MASDHDVSNAGSSPRGWQKDLRRKIGWLLAVKVLALLLLRGLFFAPDHHVEVSGSAMSAALGLTDSDQKQQDRPND